MRKSSIFFGVIVALICELSIMFIKLTPKPLPNNGDLMVYSEDIILEDITCNELINKYNNLLKENDLFQIDLNYLTVVDGTYYVGLFQDILLFITPVECEDIASDFVYQAGIILDEDTNNFDLAVSYYKHLITANNEFIGNHEELIDILLKDDAVSKNNGLILGKVIDNNEINLFMERKRSN